MKRLLFVPVLWLLILSGCLDDQNGKLDTSKLEKIEPKGNMTDEQKKSYPISYNAPSLEEGLDALPFDVKLPDELSFKSEPFELSSIEDFEHDGKNLRVNFTTFSKDRNEKILLMITLHNFKVEYDGSGTDVDLDEGVEGNYSGNSLLFNKDGIIYNIGYTNPKLSPEKHKEEIIKMANQMLH